MFLGQQLLYQFLFMFCKCSSTLWFPRNPACQGRHGFTSLPPPSFSQLFSFPDFHTPLSAAKRKKERRVQFLIRKKWRGEAFFLSKKEKILSSPSRKKFCRIYGENIMQQIKGNFSSSFQESHSLILSDWWNTTARKLST